MAQTTVSMKQRRKWAMAARIVLALVVLAYALFPVVWIFSASLDPRNTLVNQTLIPPRANFDNYVKLFTSDLLPFRQWLLNSTRIAVTTTVLTLFMTAFAAYAFSRFRFRGRRSVPWWYKDQLPFRYDRRDHRGDLGENLRSCLREDSLYC